MTRPKADMFQKSNQPNQWLYLSLYYLNAWKWSNFLKFLRIALFICTTTNACGMIYICLLKKKRRDGSVLIIIYNIYSTVLAYSSFICCCHFFFFLFRLILSSSQDIMSVSFLLAIWRMKWIKYIGWMCSLPWWN